MPFFRLYVVANELADIVPYDTHLLYPVSAYPLLLENLNTLNKFTDDLRR